MKNILEDELKYFKSKKYPIYKNPKIKDKKLIKNNKIFIFCLYSFLICFLLYFFIFGLHFELKSEISSNKNNLHIYYDEFGKKLFDEKKIISFDYLNEFFYGIKRNYSNFDNIHLLFAFNNEYYLLALVTITSILKTANNNSFIHIHIIASKGFEYETMKKLNSLKGKINKNVEFIFYDGSRIEEDFGSHIKNEICGAGEYAKLLGPVLVDKKIDRIIALDAGDLLIQKDLLELYNYPLDDYLIRGCFDPLAPCYANWSIFYLKEGYLNAGVYLYNLKKWREMDIYNDILKFYKYLNFTHKLIAPHQDIINCFLPSASIGLLPIKYNLQEYIDFQDPNDDQKGSSLYTLNCSYYYGKKNEIIEGVKNIVIWHYTKSKIHKGEGPPFLTKQWIKYAEITGFYKEIKQSYPNAFIIK
jgi:lipopolysaccharide biosynthesis glycosyltransferase